MSRGNHLVVGRDLRPRLIAAFLGSGCPHIKLVLRAGSESSVLVRLANLVAFLIFVRITFVVQVLLYKGISIIILSPQLLGGKSIVLLQINPVEFSTYEFPTFHPPSSTCRLFRPAVYSIHPSLSIRPSVPSSIQPSYRRLLTCNPFSLDKHGQQEEKSYHLRSSEKVEICLNWGSDQSMG